MTELRSTTKEQKLSVQTVAGTNKKVRNVMLGSTIFSNRVQPE